MRSGLDVTIERLTASNVREDSLDGFVRTQVVKRVYLKCDDGYKLTDNPFIDDWTPERKREKARELIGGGLISYGAFVNGELIGFIGLRRELSGRRMIVSTLHVSSPYRGHGIGRMLFLRGMDEARGHRADELYISACFAEETVAFYRAMGAELTDQPIMELIEDEPLDLQMICKI